MADDVEQALSTREMHVLQLLADGCTREEMAAALFVGRGTLISVMQRVYTKLGARNGPHAVHIAWQWGLLGADVSAAANGGGR